MPPDRRKPMSRFRSGLVGGGRVSVAPAPDAPSSFRPFSPVPPQATNDPPASGSHPTTLANLSRPRKRFVRKRNKSVPSPSNGNSAAASAPAPAPAPSDPYGRRYPTTSDQLSRSELYAQLALDETIPSPSNRSRRPFEKPSPGSSRLIIDSLLADANASSTTAALKSTASALKSVQSILASTSFTLSASQRPFKLPDQIRQTFEDPEIKHGSSQTSGPKRAGTDTARPEVAAASAGPSVLAAKLSGLSVESSGLAAGLLGATLGTAGSDGDSDKIRKPPLTRDDLEIVRRLGAGGFGQVNLVQVKSNPETQFAMKSVQKAFHRELERNWFKVQGPYVKEEKNKERRILSKLPWNPFICGLVDAFHDQQNLYLLLELAPCNSLYEYLYEHGPLPADRVRFYFANLVLALEFIHSHGIVHRDVKPGNILMGADGYLCLTDFGCALEQELDYEWERVGTADYVAPEIRPEELVFRPRGSRNLDPRSLPPPEARHMIDWWAAAITLYEMATFKRPFHGEDGQQIYTNIKRQVISWPEDREIDPDLKDLVTKMLIDDPLKRYGCFVAKEPGEEVGMNDEVRIHPFMWGKVSWKRITERRELAPDVPKPEPDMTQQWQQQGMPMPWHVPGFDLAAVATERAWDNRFEHR